MKILLVCAAGLSTSILMKKLEKYAEQNGIELDIDAGQHLADQFAHAPGLGDMVEIQWRTWHGAENPRQQRLRSRVASAHDQRRQKAV